MPLDLQQFESVQITINVEEIKNRFTADQEFRQRQCSEQYRYRVEAYKAMKQSQEQRRENSSSAYSVAAVYSLGESQSHQNGNGLNSHSLDDHPRPEAETEYDNKRQKLETFTTTDLNATVNDLLNVPAPVPTAPLTVADDVKEEIGSVAMEIVTNDTNLRVDESLVEVEI